MMMCATLSWYVKKLLTIQIPFFQSAASSGSLRRSRSPSLFSRHQAALISYRISLRTLLRTSPRTFRGCVARDFRYYMRIRSLGAPQLVGIMSINWERIHDFETRYITIPSSRKTSFKRRGRSQYSMQTSVLCHSTRRELTTHWQLYAHYL